MAAQAVFVLGHIPTVAQTAGETGIGEKLLLVTPMTGAGTWSDPRRPAIPPGDYLQIRWISSDDGRSAIVELRVPDRKSLARVLAGRQPEMKSFETGINGRDDVLRELQKLKKDFRFEDFAVAGRRPILAGAEVKP